MILNGSESRTGPVQAAAAAGGAGGLRKHSLEAQTQEQQKQIQTGLKEARRRKTCLLKYLRISGKV